jgi:serine/threonine protein phosphatase PrpC
MRGGSKGTEECREALEIGAVCVPLAGQDVCGDTWMFCQDAHHAVMMVVDGLGHGYEASVASQAAVTAVESDWIGDVEGLATRVHETLRPTRGAVAGIAAVDLSDARINYVGIGNISASITEWDVALHMVSMNGTAGLAASIKSFRYHWAKDGILVMTSDGITNHWKLSSYPGLCTSHPSIIAGVLYQHFCRGKDDATALVVRWKQG